MIHEVQEKLISPLSLALLRFQGLQTVDTNAWNRQIGREPFGSKEMDTIHPWVTGHDRLKTQNARKGRLSENVLPILGMYYCSAHTLKPPTLQYRRTVTC